MKIILGMTGSGKSKKIAELASKDVTDNKKVKIFSNELIREDYIAKIKDFGGWNPNLISISLTKSLNPGKIIDLMNSIINGYEREEFDTVYIDLLIFIKDYEDLDLLNMLEKYTGIPIYVSVQTSRTNDITSKENPLIITSWEHVRERLLT